MGQNGSSVAVATDHATVRAAVAELFRAYGIVSADRADVYVRDIIEHPARWSNVEVRAGCTRARQRSKLASVPPIGQVFAAMHEVREEDQRHARASAQRIEAQVNPDWSAADERAHMRLLSRLYAAGLDYCDVTQRWVAAGQAQHLAPDDPRYRPVQIHETQRAVEALRRGEIVGNEQIRAWRKRTGIGRAIDREAGVTLAQAAVFD